MSNEPVKSIEIDCPISPYSQHQNHHSQHHVLTCHQSHNHHLPKRLENPNPIDARIRDDHVNRDVDDDDVDRDDLNDDQIGTIRCIAQSKLNDCNDRIKCKSTQYRHQTIIQDGTNLGDNFLADDCNGLTKGHVSITDTSDRYELANTTIASSTSTSPTSLHSSSPPSSSSSDSSSSIEDGDDEGGDDDDEEDNADIESNEEDDDEDEVESDDDSEDIVDPVGNNQNGENESGTTTLMNPSLDYNHATRTSNPVAEQADESLSEDEDEDDYDDASFDENEDSDDASEHQLSRQSNNETAHSPDLLDSERMLEVTRKLVKSTERDPDRDLRKQVLLKTAIRKLPHFMEYNHYSDSFDQSFHSHNNSLSCNTNDGSNVTVNCLPTAQYYEPHHQIHLNHHLEVQPKSYYHSVQPNAIQMSTTSLRMLDLNDDHETETANVIDGEQQHQAHHHLGTYGVNIENNVQTSLDQQHPHDYANHSQQQTLNMYHYTHQSTEHLHHHTQLIESNDLNDHQSQSADQIASISAGNQPPTNVGLTTSTFAQETGINMIAHHDTIDNLYQPISSDDIGVNETSVEDSTPISFPIICNYTGIGEADKESRIELSSNDDDKISENEIKTFNNLDETANKQTDVINAVVSIENSQEKLERPENNQYSECHQNESTTVNNYFSNGLVSVKPINEIVTDSNLTNPPDDAGIIDDTLLSRASIIHDKSPSLLSTSGASDGNSNSSTSSISSSDDGFVPGPKQIDLLNDRPTNNDSSLLDSSHNTTNDYHHNPNDSGVALYSPRSNKRSSSSIGLDDEMEIDHLGDFSSTSYQTMSSGSNVNHCKKLRKREISDEI